MKKLLMIMLVLLVLTGCTKEKKEPEGKSTDYLGAYGEVLNNVYDAIYAGLEDEDYYDELIGLIESVSYLPAKSALKKIGYCLKDLNDDEVPELLIGSVTPDFDGGNSIYAVYHLEDEAVIHSFSGWYRNNICLLDNGHLYLNGSAGAALSFFGEYMVDEAGNLKAIDFYFTDYKDGNMEEVGLYHNQTAIFEANDEDLFKGSDEEFFELSNRLYERTVVVEFTPFFALKDYVSKTVYYPTDEELAVFWPVAEGEYFTAGTCWNSDASEIVLAPKDEVSEVTVYSIENFSVDANGEPVYDLGWSGYYPEISAEKPLKAAILMPEVVPTMAVAYKNKAGVEKLVSVMMSGEDGSLYLMELK